MRIFLSWMRQVLPRDTIVATAVLADLVIEGFYIHSLAWWGFADEPAYAGFRLAVQMLAVFLYGGHRVATFHPASDAEYRKWQEQTPWTPRNPLPMGPVHLVLQDAVVIGASMLLTRIYDERVLYVPVVFLSSYCFSLAVMSRVVGEKWPAYLLGAALGFVIAYIQQPVHALLAALGATIFTPWAVQRSLARFPWELPWFADGRTVQQIKDEFKQGQWGWPFDVFAPKVPHAWVTTFDGLGLSLVAGWWFFTVYHQLPEGRFIVVAFWSQLVLAAAIVRIGAYARNHRPPISVAGRISTLRPWQAGYDLIFIAPALACAVVFAATMLTVLISAVQPIPIFGGVLLAKSTEPVVTTAGFTASLLLLLLGGPHAERWRLIGRHRMVFQHSTKTTGLGSSEKNQEFVQTA